MNELNAGDKALKIIYKNRFRILLISIVFLIASILITLFIPKKYIAEGMVYPTKSNSMKDVANNPFFGYELQASRLVQLFESQQMRNRITKRFDLISYYELDTNDIGWYKSLNEHLEDDITIERTKYLSIRIIAETRSPELSAAIVNYMIDYIDTLRQDVFLKNTIIWVDDLRQRVARQNQIVDSLLVEIFQEESESVQNLISTNKLAHINKRKENASVLMGDELIREAISNNYSLRMEKLTNEYYFELGTLNLLLEELKKGELVLSQPFPKVYVIAYAQVNRHKSSPSLAINSVAGWLIGLLAGIFYYLGRNKWNEVRETLR